MTFSSVFVTVTVAFATKAPLLSLTVPTIVPVTTWANAAVANRASTATATIMSMFRGMTSLLTSNLRAIATSGLLRISFAFRYLSLVVLNG